jgi:hypothetical protein
LRGVSFLVNWRFKMQTFNQKHRLYWAEILTVAKANPSWKGIFSYENKRAWALRCLSMAGPVGKLP